MREGAGNPPRSAGARALRVALAQVVGLSVLLAVIEIALYPGLEGPQILFATAAALGVLYVAVGAFAWARRPSNRIGALLAFAGFAILAVAATPTTLPLLATIGEHTTVLPLAVVLHLLLAFPSGQLRDRGPRLFAAGAYVSALSVKAGSIHLGGDPAAWAQAEDVTGAILVGFTTVVLVKRIRASSGARRRTLTPLYAYGTFTLLFMVFSAQILRDRFGVSPVTVFALQQVVLAGLPFAFLAGVLRGGFARTGELEELGAWLSATDDGRATLRDALRATLGDPTLDLWYWLPEDGRYVDSAGAPVDAHGRAVLDVELHGERIGAIAYDGELIADPSDVRAAGRVIAVAVDRERLTAVLQANQRALAESRSRLVTAGDLERRRIARDLHDGVQSRLVALAMRAGRLAADPTTPAPLAAEASELRTTAEATLDELRDLVQGIMPALLVERGLCAATEDLVDRVPVPTDLELATTDGDLPQEVETTAYFVVAEALTNAVKHAEARHVRVRVGREQDVLAVEVHDDGVGGATELRSLRDRVDALGGRLTVDSPAGAGTRVLAELPCA